MIPFAVGYVAGTLVSACVVLWMLRTGRLRDEAMASEYRAAGLRVWLS